MISFVIPCYRSANTIQEVVGGIKMVVAERKQRYEIILVNDSSPDNTFEVIQNLCEADPQIKGINLARNFGQHAALMAGFHAVSGEVVVCLDDDGQTPPSEAFKLIDMLETYDVAVTKYANKQHGVFRNIGSRINDKMASWLLGKPKNLSFMSYFACKRFIIDEVVRYTNPYPYVIGLVLRTTNSIVNVEIVHQERLAGKSGYTMGKLLALWFNGFTAFSVKPLRVATVFGLLVALAGFGLGIFAVINKLITPDVPIGYSSMMAAFMFIGGTIMLMLGLIGEYIGRMYISLNSAPQFVIKESCNLEESAGTRNEK